jgi:pimeloyl-ACP methyl ester carboxylesterase
MLEMVQKNRQGENGGSRRRVYRWLKILGLLTLALFFTLGALFIIGRLLTSRLETETDPRALAPWGPGTSFLSTRSGDVHILDIGEGDVILLVHGSSGSIADWQETVADRLAESYRVVAFDSYGFGLSERNDSFEYGHALWTQQAIDVLDALEIERAVVLGHSAGAITAVILAADHPERIRGSILTGHGLTFDPAQLVPVLPGIGELWAARRTVIGDTFSDSYREQVEAVHRIRGTRAAYLAFVRSQYSSPTSLRLFGGTYEDIEVPVLQMHGALDQSQDIDSARELSSRLADTRFVAIEGSDHHVHIDAPDRWAEEVAAFVASLSP